MVTTIQVREETMEQLKQLRTHMKAKSYDEVVQNLVRHQNIESMYGFLGKKSRAWILKDLRDKHDRF